MQLFLITNEEIEKIERRGEQGERVGRFNRNAVLCSPGKSSPELTESLSNPHRSNPITLPYLPIGPLGAAPKTGKLHTLPYHARLPAQRKECARSSIGQEIPHRLSKLRHKWAQE